MLSPRACPVVEACVAVRGRVGEVRVAADEPEAVNLDPGVLARSLDDPASVKVIPPSTTIDLIAGLPRSPTGRTVKI